MLSRIAPILAAASVVSTGKTPQSKLNTSQDNRKLVNVQVFVRHGARTPIHCIASDTWARTVKWEPSVHKDLLHKKIDFKLLDIDTNEEINSEEGLKCVDDYELHGGAQSGQLTTIGQKEMYEFGRELRKKYVEDTSLIEIGNMSDVSVRSTRMKRTIDSAKCLLAGFYCSNNDSTPKGPINIYSSNRATEILYPNSTLCPFLKVQKLKGMKTNMKLHKINATKELLRNILEVHSLKRTAEGAYENATDADDLECSLYHVRDEYISRIHHGHAVPEEIKGLMPLMNRLCSQEMICELLGSETYGKEDLKLVIGPVVSLILNNIDQVKLSDVQSNVSSQKFQIHVTHDSTLIPLLLSLGSFNGEWPNFGESLIFELYKDDKNYWVKILYSNKPLIIKEMGATEKNPMVPLKLFESYMKPYRVENLENYCKQCKSKMRKEDFDMIQSAIFKSKIFLPYNL